MCRAFRSVIRLAYVDGSFLSLRGIKATGVSGLTVGLAAVALDGGGDIVRVADGGSSVGTVALAGNLDTSVCAGSGSLLVDGTLPLDMVGLAEALEPGCLNAGAAPGAFSLSCEGFATF